MIRDVLMPQLAMGMSEGTIVEWFAGEGQRVTREAPLLSIETEKVVTDIPAPHAGWIHRIAETGTAIPIETVIGKIAETEAEYQSLQTATLNPARYFHEERIMGTVEPGKLADLVLLDADPLADIRNTSRIRAVIANGAYLSRAVLDARLQAVEVGSKHLPGNKGGHQENER